MAQINIHVTADFERDLKRLMRARKLDNKSEAIRLAVRESLQRLESEKRRADIRKLIGIARGDGENPNPRFTDEDQLWEKG